MFCGKCGAEVASGKFCPRCGAPLNMSASVADDEATVLAENNTFSDEPTAVAADDATVMAYDDATVAARDFEATVAAPVYGMSEAVSNAATPPVMPLDPKAAKKAKKAEKKANKKPMSTKKKVLVAISSILAFVIVLGSVAVGVVAFTPKYKFMLALYNTFRMKSFEMTTVVDTYTYKDFEEGDSDALWDYDGKDWEFESGSYSKTTHRVDRMCYQLGEGMEDSEIYFTSEYTRELKGSGRGRERYTEDSFSYMNISEDYFSSSYEVYYGGEIISGYTSGEDGYADEGEFYGGKASAYYEYLEKNSDDYKAVVENHRFTEDYIVDTLKSFAGISGDTKEFEYDEWLGIIYDLLSIMFKEGAIEIVDTRIEDGMTKYDVRFDHYLMDKCRLDYTEENDEYKRYLKSKETYDGSNEYIDLKDKEKSDYEDLDPMEFTLGTKGMRLVYFLSETENYEGADKSSTTIEYTITNINKKMDYVNQYNDIKAIADQWKENYTYCETAADFKAYFDKDSE